MRTCILLFVALVGSIADIRAALEFSAYLTSGGTRQFLLTDLDTGSKSSWLAIGDSFSGHLLVKFDPQGETLTLDQAGKSVLMRLKDSKIVEERPEASTKIEVEVFVSAEGAVILDGKAINQLALIEHFENLARSERRISLTIQPPQKATRQNSESVRKILNSFSVSGAKGSISIMKVQPPK